MENNVVLNELINRGEDESTFIDPETLDLCEDLIMFADKKFCSECYPEDKDFSVYDLVAKYGLKNILINYMDYVRKKG